MYRKIPLVYIWKEFGGVDHLGDFHPVNSGRIQTRPSTFIRNLWYVLAFQSRYIFDNMDDVIVSLKKPIFSNSALNSRNANGKCSLELCFQLHWLISHLRPMNFSDYNVIISCRSFLFQTVIYNLPYRTKYVYVYEE